MLQRNFTNKVILYAFFVVLVFWGTTDGQTKNSIQSKEIELRASAWTKEKGFLKDLSANDFEISSGKEKLKIISVEQNDDPVSIGILIDLSASFHDSDKRYTTGLFALEKFLEQSNSNNEYFILGFAEDQKLILNNTANRDAIHSAVDQLKLATFDGSTAIWDAIERGVERLSKTASSRKALVVLSDGKDNVSKIDFNDLKKITRQNSIRIFQIFPVIADDEERPSLSIDTQRAFSFAEQLGNDSGGMTMFPDNTTDLVLAFQKVAESLRSQYVIKTRIRVESDKPAWHKLKWKMSKESKSKFGKITISAPDGIFQ